MAKEIIDMMGHIIGKLTVVERVGNQWKCLCECGNTRIFTGTELRTQGYKSCGCLSRKLTQQYLNLIGEKFGRLTVIAYAYAEGGRHYWFCECECNPGTVLDEPKTGKYLRCKGNKSCGCLKSEASAQNYKKAIEHNKATNEVDRQKYVGKTYNGCEVLRAWSNEDIKSPSTLFEMRCYCFEGNIFVAKAYFVKTNENLSCGCGYKLQPGQSQINNIIQAMKSGAIRRKLFWDVSDEFISGLIKKNCYYCNASPKYKKYQKAFLAGATTNGVDRIDSLKGYIENNLVACCFDCNRAKKNFRLEEWLTYLNNMVNNNSIQRQIKFLPISSYNSWVKNVYKSNPNRIVKISYDEWKILIVDKCYYCGLYGSIKDRVYYLNTIDRLDPSLDYIAGNMVACCKFCNYGKNKYEETYWFEHIHDMKIYLKDNFTDIQSGLNQRIQSFANFP